MKKICLICIVFSLLVFVGCSDGTKKAKDLGNGETVTDEDADADDSDLSDTSDSGENGSDTTDSGDPADSGENGSDTTDSGDSTDSGSTPDSETSDSDTTETGKDDADSQPDEDADSGVAEPTKAEICSQNQGQWIEEQNKCKKLFPCDEQSKPQHAVWTGQGLYTGEWNYDNNEWDYLEHTVEYGENQESCHFKCEPGYLWYNDSCVDDPCDPDPCSEIAKTDSEHSCTVGEDVSKYECGCIEKYKWDSDISKCVPDVHNCSDNVTTPCRDGKYVWSSKAPNEMKWDNAILHCKGLDEGGFTDWELASISALRTLIVNCPGTEANGSCKISDECSSYYECWSGDDCYTCTNGSSKFGQQENWLWSSTPFPESESKVKRWGVHFTLGRIGNQDADHENAVRCVIKLY